MKRIRLQVLKPTQDMVDEFEAQTRELSAADKQTALKLFKEKSVFKFKDALIGALRSPLDQRQGLTIEEVEQSISILTTIKATDEIGVLELDDKEVEFIESKLAAVRLTRFDERWVILKSVLKNATKDLLDETPIERKRGKVRRG